nr:hypothetical protein [Tanacetum cinerariifolium]
YGVVPTAFVTTTALSTTFTFASSILPIATDGYEIVGVDGQEGAGTNGRAVADRNVAPFPNVRGSCFPSRALNLYAPFPSAFVTSYGPSHLGPSFFVSSARVASLLRYTRSHGMKLALRTLEL